MAKVFQALDDRLVGFIQAQHLFFVATAPASEGHINLSPKGLDGLRVLGPKRVAYLDYPGSGVETIAHLRENGRIVIMLCAFEGPPNIVRLHGRGQVIEPDAPDFEELLGHFSPTLAPRSIIVVDVERISDSCGYGVPLYEYQGERDQLARWADKKVRDGKLDQYCRDNNAKSIDGLPGLAWVQEKQQES